MTLTLPCVFDWHKKKKPNHYGQAFDAISLLLQVFLLLFHVTDAVLNVKDNGFQGVISIIL